jgi:aspartyl/asparaginyl-tRNA synthetase
MLPSNDIRIPFKSSLTVHATEALRKRTLQVKWGADLQSEHERYLTEVAFSGNPVIVSDYPKVLISRIK